MTVLAHERPRSLMCSLRASTAAAVFKSPFAGFCTSGGECEVLASDFERGSE